MIERPLPVRALPLRPALVALRPLNRYRQSAYMNLVARLLRRAGVVLDGQPLWVAPSVTLDLGGTVALGAGCVLSENVVLLTHDHSLDRYAEEHGLLPRDEELYATAGITIGARAFLGFGSVVLPGVTVGPGAVVGANSTVTSDVPAGEIWAGNPARRIRTVAEQYELRGHLFRTRSRRP